MPSSNRNTLSVPATPWGLNWLLDADASGGLDDLGFSAYTKTLPVAANSGALLRLQNLPWYNVADYASVNAAVAAGGAGPYVLHVSAHTHVTANLVLGSTIDVVIDPGADIEVDNGVTFTIADPSHVRCGMTQRAFTLTGTGLVAFTDGGLLWAGWWGLSTANAAAANATGLNAALAAAFVNTCDLFIYGSENTAYACGAVGYTNTTGSPVRGPNIVGIGRPVFDHSSLAGAAKAWSFEPTVANAVEYHMSIQNLKLLGPESGSNCWNDGGAVTTTRGISVRYILHLKLVDVEIKYFYEGIYAEDSYLRDTGCLVWGCLYGLHLANNCSFGYHQSTFDTNYINVYATGNVYNQTFMSCLLQHAGLDGVLISPGTGKMAYAWQFINPYFETIAQDAFAFGVDAAGADVDGNVFDVLISGGTQSGITGKFIRGKSTAGDVHSITILNAYGVDATADIGGMLRNTLLVTGNTSTTYPIWFWDDTGRLTYPAYDRARVSATNPASMPNVRTLIVSIDVDDDASTDDYQFDDDQANTTKQTITLTGILPACAQLLSFEIRCFETVTGSASMLIELGTSSGGAELYTGSPDTANDLGQPATGAALLAQAVYAGQTLYFSGTPGANWNTLNAGRWALLLTYIDYSAVFNFAGL